MPQQDTNDRIIRELRAEIERLRKEVAGQQKSASPVRVVCVCVCARACARVRVRV
jgi:hypothetical protein